MQSTDIDNKMDEEFASIITSSISQDSILITEPTCSVKAEGISDASSNTIKINQATPSVDGSHQIRTRTLKVSTSDSALNFGTKLIFAAAPTCLGSSVVVSEGIPSSRFPVKLLVTADARNNKAKSNSFGLGSGAVVKGSQPTLMCVANSLPSVMTKMNKVALIPAQNLTFVANSSPKKVAVISVPVKQPLSKSVVQTDQRILNSSGFGIAVDSSSVINLVDSSSSVKVEVASETKNIQLVNLNPTVVQANLSEVQMLTQIPVQSTSSLLSQTTAASSAANQVKFVKLLTVPSHDEIRKKSSNKPLVKSAAAASSVHLIVPPGKGIATSQAVSSAAVTLPFAQVKVAPPKRAILPSPWKTQYDQSVSADELKTAVAHMTKQAALTMIDIQRQSSTVPAVKAAAAPVASRKSNDSRSNSAVEMSTQSVVSSSSGNDAIISVDRMRRPCNCSKSQCLKLYCECFANGEFCSDCNCFNCANNLKHEDDRQRAIRACLERNPFAFHPKIGKSRGDSSRQHSKGCHCKRSSCLKNYCECYEAKIMCTELCKCFGCKNFESNVMNKTLQYLADAADKRSQQQLAATNRFDSEISYIMKPVADTNGKRPPHSFITMDVVEATNACLLATAEECIAMFHSDGVMERQLLEEFGRCLEQVIDAANRSSAF